MPNVECRRRAPPFRTLVFDIQVCGGLPGMSLEPCIPRCVNLTLNPSPKERDFLIVVNMKNIIYIK